jgi:hypothetical protein
VDKWLGLRTLFRRQDAKLFHRGNDGLHAPERRRVSAIKVLQHWAISSADREHEEEKTAYLYALFDRLALIVPILITALHAALLTTSLFVVSCGGVGVVDGGCGGKYIIAAMAGYAAILVAFVGAATDTTG